MSTRRLAAATAIATLVSLGLGSPAAFGSARLHHHHHRRLGVAAPPVVPPGYAYGGYGNGVGPGWELSGEDPGYGGGFAPGYGYFGPGIANYGLDLGY